MNNIIKSSIAVCAVFAAATAFGDSATSSNRFEIQSTIYNANNDRVQVHIVVDHRFPDSDYLGLSGYIGGQSFDCGEQSAAVANMLDMVPTATVATVQVNTSQITCTQGTPPAQISMNCVANGRFFNSSIVNVRGSQSGVRYQGHANVNASSVNCSGKADELVFDITDYAYVAYTQYMNK